MPVGSVKQAPPVGSTHDPSHGHRGGAVSDRMLSFQRDTGEASCGEDDHDTISTSRGSSPEVGRD